MNSNCIDTAFFGQICDSCDGGGVYLVLKLVIQVLSYGIAVLAVIGIVIGAIVYLTSGGDPGKTTKAKSRIQNVVLGIIAYGLILSFLNWLIPGGVFGATSSSQTSYSCPTNSPQISSGGEDSRDSATKPATNPTVTPADTPVETPTTPQSTAPTTTVEPVTGNARARACGPTVSQTTLQTEGTYGGYNTYLASNGRSYYIYKQSDSRWKDIPRNGSTIGQIGCRITGIAILSTSFTNNQSLITPIQTNQNATVANVREVSSPCSGSFSDKVKCTIDQGGAVMVHICQETSGSKKCPNSGNHHYPIVDYRYKNGVLQYYQANTVNSSSYATRQSGWVNASLIDPYICSPAGPQSCDSSGTIHYYLPKDSSLSCTKTVTKTVEQTQGNKVQDKSAQVPTTSGTTAQKMAQMAVSVAWPYTSGPNAGKCPDNNGKLVNYNPNKTMGVSKYGEGYCNYSLKDEYISLIKTYYSGGVPAHKIIKDSTDRGVNSHFYDRATDCAVFIRYLLTYFGIDEKNNISTGKYMVSYLEKKTKDSSSGWIEIENKKSTSNLQPGDILVNSAHVMIYVGSELGAGYGDTVGASHWTWTPRIHNIYYTHDEGGAFQIFRYTK